MCLIGAKATDFDELRVSVTNYIVHRTRVELWALLNIYIHMDARIGWDGYLSPGRRQAIIWTCAGILLTVPRGANFNETLIIIHIFYSRTYILKCRLENGGHFVSALMCQRPGSAQTRAMGCLLWVIWRKKMRCNWRVTGEYSIYTIENDNIRMICNHVLHSTA